MANPNAFSKLTTAAVLLFMSVFSFGQELNPELFGYEFTPTKKGGAIVYFAENRYIKITIAGNKIKPVLPTVGKTAPNQHFMTVDSTLVQTSMVQLPEPLPENFDLNHLSLQQQETLLERYVSYEANYIGSELHLKIDDVKTKAVTVHSRRCLFWQYQHQYNNPVKGAVNGQLYLSMICFNQVLSFNVPITDHNSGTDYQNLLTQLAKGVDTFSKKYSKRATSDAK